MDLYIYEYQLSTAVYVRRAIRIEAVRATSLVFIETELPLWFGEVSRECSPSTVKDLQWTMTVGFNQLTKMKCRPAGDLALSTALVLQKPIEPPILTQIFPSFKLCYLKRLESLIITQKQGFLHHPQRSTTDSMVTAFSPIRKEPDLWQFKETEDLYRRHLTVCEGLLPQSTWRVA